MSPVLGSTILYSTPWTGTTVTSSSVDGIGSDIEVILPVSVIPYPFNTLQIPNRFAVSLNRFICEGIIASPPINTYLTSFKESSFKPEFSNVAKWLGATSAIFALESIKSLAKANLSYLGL